MSDKESNDWIDDVCPACNGSGAEVAMRPVDRKTYPKLNPTPCPACGGTGRTKPKPATTGL